MTAGYAAKHGLTVTVMEEGYAGGTCLNCGCIPTKTFCRDAELALQGVSTDFAQLTFRKQQIVEQLRAGVESLLQQPGITLVRGHAQFKDAHTVTVGTEEYVADHIIIATGSSPKMPPIEGIDHSSVVTSTELLDIDHVPARLCIVGAGVIGMEFASIFNAFGSEVTVVEFLKECLPPMDGDIAKRLRKQLEKRGVKFYMQAGVKRISDEGVTFEQKGKEQTVAADIVLIATGRKPNSDGLNLEAVGITTNRGAIPVDDNMETSVKGIYAIGDVNARCMLAHAATFQGYRAVNNIIGKQDNIRFDIMPSAVFTTPEVAGVGVSDKDCEADKTLYTVHKGFYRANGKALSMNATEGIVKIYTDAADNIVGCHIMGAHAADLVQEVSVLMNKGTKLAELRDMIHIHPTLGEILLSAAEA